MSAEDVFVEVLEIIDSIREQDTTEEIYAYVRSVYGELYSAFKGRVDGAIAEAVSDIQLCVAEVVYGAAVALLLSDAANTQTLALRLIRQIPDAGMVKKLMALFQPAADALTLQAKNEWKTYYHSDSYLTEQIITLAAQSTYCEYLVPEVLTQHCESVDGYEEMLKVHCKRDAATLVSFLQSGEERGCLHFKKHSKKQIFETLKAHFPDTIKYTYPNFNDASVKAGWKCRKRAAI